MRSNVPEIFGSMVFNDAIMSSVNFLKTFTKHLKKTIEDGKAFRYYCSQCGCHCHEGLGDRKRRYPLYTLVPADDRDHR